MTLIMRPRRHATVYLTIMLMTTGILHETMSTIISFSKRDDSRIDIDFENNVDPDHLKQSRYANAEEYTLNRKPPTDIFSPKRPKRGIAAISSSREKIHEVITNNEPQSQTRNNGISIRPKHSDLRKLDTRLYKVSPSGELSNSSDKFLGETKPNNNSSNSIQRHSALNHAAPERGFSTEEVDKNRRCIFHCQLGSDNGSALSVTSDDQESAGVKTPDLRNPAGFHVYKYVKHLINKRDAINDTSYGDKSKDYKPVPSTVDVHKSLFNLYKNSLNFTVDMKNPNDTLEAMRQCLGLLITMFDGVVDDGNTYCDTDWDKYSCWPRTLAGTNASIPCPSYLQGINDLNNASKLCHENGTWADKAVYDLCVIDDEEPLPLDLEVDHLFAIRVIYNAGFTISTLALFIALFIFLYFRSLYCLRNYIHCHLIMTFVLKNLVWIIMRHSLTALQHEDYSGVCKMLTSLFNFTHATNFFWMFVEGLYLHIIIVWTYSADKIRLWYLVIIGWVLPAVDVIVWIVTRVKFEDDHCWLPKDNGVSELDYIVIGPILIVLFANIIFLSTIVWVLITKLRASHTLETRQYRKAVKATIILFPLLGITYVLFIMPPSDHPNVKIVFKYINAILQSFQGLLVAVFYCFLNGEVKGVLKKKITRFNDARSLSTKYTKTSMGWTRGYDYGNSVSMGNGTLVEMNKPVEQVPMRDINEAETDKML